MEFRGQAKPLGNGAVAAVAAAAAVLGCDTAAVRAVIAVESRGGFDRHCRPRILFERHYFHRLTAGRFSANYPDISAPRWGGYGRASAQYDRLRRAAALNRDAALRSASWGMFQIMGNNARAAGFDDIEAFVAAMMEGEDRHLEAFVAFVRHQRLDGALTRHDWAGFARGYNGPAFAANRYDHRLAEAYASYAQPFLQLGSRGGAVRDLQARLDVRSDGTFGPVTQVAVRAFQRSAGLAADGIVGPVTRAALAAG